MKEISIEEKAKAYDNIIEKANRMHSENCEACQICIEELIPELKESEDERVRNKLIEFFKGYSPDEEWWGNITQEDILAWLEKQGEQEPADKVEPKFHESDWVVNTVGDTNQVVKVLDDGYTLDDNTFISNSWATEHYHLWTIQDAKLGDVLHSPSHRLIWIYKDNEHYHACVNMNYVTENVATDGLINIPNDVCPATKDEQTILFANMKEAGYEWDAEKKELRKVEQEQTEFPNGEDYGIDGLYHAISILEKTLGQVEGYQSDDGILEHKAAMTAIKKLYKQKPVELKKEEKSRLMKKCVHRAYQQGYDTGFFMATTELEHKQEWSEEDERIYKVILELMDSYSKGTIGGCIISPNTDRYIKWFKSLKARYTWKPSDEQKGL